MDERIAVYCKTDNSVSWPRSILQSFAKESTKGQMFVFPAAGDREREFAVVAAQQAIPCARMEYIRCDGAALWRYPFHYLRIKPDRDYEKNDYMDQSRRCRGDERLICRAGVSQRAKIVLDPARSKALDIMYDSAWIRPSIILISRAMKDNLNQMAATGFELIPCLSRGDEYSEEEISLNGKCPELSERASYFQLRVTTKVLSPPCVGELERISMQCSACGAVHLYKSSESPYFQPEDLSNADFQTSDGIRSLDGRSFALTVEQVIISSRVLQMFLEDKVRGLAKYMVEPDIPFGVVDIK